MQMLGAIRIFFRNAYRKAFALFPLLLWGGSFSFAKEIKMLDFDKANLPKGLVYKGKIVAGARWLDGNGENILILTQTGAFESAIAKKQDDPDNAENDMRDAELFGYHYVAMKGEYQLLWKIYDFVKECPFDLDVGFLPNSLAVTDLDHDGIGESTFLYKLACRSDINPATLKLIMHEGKDKFAIRGSTKTADSGGEKVIDPSYSKAPAIFKEFSLQRWEEFVEEKSFDQFD
jgi:hypothetical protein